MVNNIYYIIANETVQSFEKEKNMDVDDLVDIPLPKNKEEFFAFLIIALVFMGIAYGIYLTFS